MDKMSAVKEAIQDVLGIIQGADAREMVGRRKPQAVSVEVEAKPEACEGCAKGECMDPDHASEADLSAMLGEDRG